MAVVEKEFGKNANFYVQGKLVACAESIEMTITIEEIGNKCQGNGGINSKRPGDRSYSFSASGVDRFLSGSDLTTNISGDEFFDLADDGTSITVIYGGPIAGDPIRTCIGYFREVKQSNQRGDNAKYDVSGWFNSVVFGTRPA